MTVPVLESDLLAIARAINEVPDETELKDAAALVRDDVEKFGGSAAASAFAHALVAAIVKVRRV